MASEPKYISTREAARRLGLSLGTVQQMVERGELQAWKTAGGHRRIDESSVDSYHQRARTGTIASQQGGRALRVLVAEDDRILQKLYEHTLGGWDLPLEVQMVTSGFDALLEIGRHPPDLLITDLNMPGLNGFEMIRRIRDNRLTAGTDIVVVSGLSDDDIADQGGLPADVTRYGKPVPFKELRGYVQAKVAQLRREHSGL
ncbi:excisionase family DNA-binding protein [Nitrogeniibacter mangrovi]|uniref:Excisionase family DNA-binding protein n=1 Tax=Nitrogeniibacter mangrovi TaxID=2016596 RepID=A0A6C1B7C5_9RHOO|nr:response regulator [Nitrogeniibacter mangrovi]QID19263.1 excisionase family DNA-binding protein [Nitrogeniibacter mangrovi]